MYFCLVLVPLTTEVSHGQSTVHGPTPPAVTKHWAAQQGLLDSSSHKVCVPCYSFSHSTPLFTTLVPLFLYLSFLTINPSLNAFFVVPILLYFYPNLTMLMPLRRSPWTSIAALLTCFPGHCWTCNDFVLQKAPSTPWNVPPLICDVWLFLT